MGYRMSEILQKMKKYLIIYIILLIAMTVVFVMPVACSIKNATDSTGRFLFDEFIGQCIVNIPQIGSSIGTVFQSEYIGVFLKTLGWYAAIQFVFFIIVMIKTKPKSEYENIEHGSSDWSEHGEQYKVLSKTAGIILAENNYLPTDKRGNVNVLIVGRFRCW